MLVSSFTIRGMGLTSYKIVMYFIHMPKESFNPSNPEYQRTEDLPVEQRNRFQNVEGGFVQREAVEVEKLAAQKAIVSALRGENLRKEDFLHEEALKEYSKRELLDTLLKIKEGGPGVSFPEGIFEDKEFLLLAVAKDQKELLNHMPKSFRDDRGFIKKIVDIDGTTLKFASGDLREDEEIVLAAIRQNPTAIQFAGANLIKGLQSQLGESANEILGVTGRIATAQNFEELYDTLRSIGILEGTGKLYAAEDLVGAIEIVRQLDLKTLEEDVKLKKGPIWDVTRTAGLRVKVFELAKVIAR